MSDLKQIATVAIYPAIGIARVGNSPDEYFFGPEIAGAHPEDSGNFRDNQGRIKRQAAKFRLFGLDKNGEVIQELTAEDADDGKISWAVHIANKKAAWYRFDQAFDIPASKGEIDGVSAIASIRRNPDIKGSQRTQLVIDPGQRVIGGCNENHDGKKPQYAFNTGTFFSKPVYLGELRTDEQGNLIFLGGKGKTESHPPNAPVVGFGNNPGWHDDTADGPVDASITINGQFYQAKGAWVIVGPPNYAPGIQAFVTGYDLLYQVAIDLKPSKYKPKTVSFYEHIYPILERLNLNQWVNAGLARDFGWGSTSDFTYPELVKRLSDSSDANRPLRQAVFARFRNPNYEVMEGNDILPVYGDAVSFNLQSQDPREWMAILPFQYDCLAKWAKGEFVVGEAPKAKSWEQMSASERAHNLTFAALEETTGGPFHPGCEFTWPMRQKIMYQEPFRIKRRTENDDNWGDQLTSSIALAPEGPLDGSAPGDITRWMACPWQTDTSSCLSAYNTLTGEYLPTFWPARVPNDVMTEEDYKILTSPDSTTEEKEQAFSLRKRLKWLRDIIYTSSYPPKLISYPPKTNGRKIFIHKWHDIGIVVRKLLPGDPNLFPKKVWVETGRHDIKPVDENDTVLHNRSPEPPTHR